MSSISAMFRTTAAAYAQRPFLVVPEEAASAYGGTAIEWTYGAAIASVDALAGLYRQAGYEGHRVGLALDNSDQFYRHWLALNAAGCSIVPLNAEQSAAELAYLLGHSEVTGVVTLPKNRDRIADAIRAGGLQVSILPPEGPDQTPQERREGLLAPDEAAIVYTSGTTGRPKGCILSNRYFTGFGTWYAALGGLCRLMPGEERLLTPLPLSHVNALCVSSMAMIATGGCVIQLDRFHPSTWWRTVSTSRATAIHYLGVMPAMLLGLPASDFDRAHDVKFGFGAAAGPTHHAAFEERFGFPLVESWAMTECGSGGAIAANLEPRHLATNCFGRPDPARTEVAIVDDTGRAVDAGEQGELLVRSALEDGATGFFSGYLKDEEATQAAWKGGWLNTGDIVRRSPDGSLHFVDRSKNIVRRSGENIASVEVEQTIIRHPLVISVAVTPIPDDIRGEEVFALITIDPEAREEISAICRAVFAYCMDNMAYYKAPGYIRIVEAIPQTSSNKIRRSELRQIAQEGLEDGSAFDFRAKKKRNNP